MKSFNLYDSTVFTIPPPPDGCTLDDAKDMVNQRMTASPPDLTRGSVRGVTSGSDQEVFLWYTLAQVGYRSRWGTEVNMVAPIGWRTTQDGSDPVGKVTVTINSAGQGVADLLSTGAAAVPTAFANIADTIRELQKADGIAAVTDGDSTWTIEDLNKVVGAFALLPSSDRAVLAGVELLRVQDIAGEHAGEFAWSQSVTGASAISSATIKIADDAFASDPKSFVGGRTASSPASYMTILHEVGHAIASQALRNTSAVADQAIAQANTLVKPLNAAVVSSNAAGEDLNALVGQYNDLVHAFNNSLTANDPAMTTAAKNDLDGKRLEVDAKRHMADRLRDVEQAKRAALDAANLNAAAKQELAQFCRPPASSIESSKSAGDSKRVLEFVEFVTLKKIPPLTQYAKDNWPSKPEEFFAEAYSLWRTDPEYLKANAMPLYDWFVEGNYLK
jgi:hypothetical protein